MRRRSPVLGALAVVALAVSMALALPLWSRGETRARATCQAQLFIEKGTSKTQTTRVGETLEAIDDVSVRFVSKKEAFETLVRDLPEGWARPSQDSSPESYVAISSYEDSCSQLGAALRPEPAGVANATFFTSQPVP